MRGRNVWTPVRGLCIVAALFATASCGDDDDDAAAATRCDAADELTTAIDDARDIDVVSEGTTELRTALEAVRVAAGDLRAALGDDLEAEADAVEAAVDRVADTAAALRDGTTAPADGARQLVTELQSAGTAVDALLEELSGECP